MPEIGPAIFADWMTSTIWVRAAFSCHVGVFNALLPVAHPPQPPSILLHALSTVLWIWAQIYSRTKKMYMFGI